MTPTLVIRRLLRVEYRTAQLSHSQAWGRGVPSSAMVAILVYAHAAIFPNSVSVLPGALVKMEAYWKL